MKRKILLVLSALLLAATAFAFTPDEYVTQSSVYTADQNAAVTGAGYLYGILIMTDGTNAVTFKTYDALTATGTKLHPDWPVTTAADDRAKYMKFGQPVAFNTGISVDITIGAGACAYIIYYRKR